MTEKKSNQENIKTNNVETITRNHSLSIALFLYNIYRQRSINMEGLDNE